MGEGELKGHLANPGSPGKVAVKTECVRVCNGTRCTFRSGRRPVLLQHGTWGWPGDVRYGGRDGEHAVGAGDLPRYRAVTQAGTTHEPAFTTQQYSTEQGERRYAVSGLWPSGPRRHHPHVSWSWTVEAKYEASPDITILCHFWFHSFIHSFIPSFIPSFLPSFLPSFHASMLPDKLVQ